MEEDEIRQKEKDRQKAYRDKNKEFISYKRRLKRQENTDSIRAKEREYYAKNKDHITLKARDNRAVNIELYRQTNKEWYSKNKERIRSVANSYRRERSDFFCNITAEWRKLNPEKIKKRDAERISNITDGYVINGIATSFMLSANERSMIPKDVIELKRLSIKLKRELKNKENE